MSEDQPTVEYRDVPGFPGYRVGDDGSVWSKWRRASLGAGGGTRCFIGNFWQALSLVNSKGYRGVSLGAKHRRKVHHLVLEAFVGPCPPGMECRHLDGNPSNNRRGNLAWGTRLENADDTRRHGRHFTPFRGVPWSPERRAKQPASCTIKKRVVCVETGCIFASSTDAARSLMVSKASVQQAIRKGCRCKGNHWRFAEASE